MRLVIKIVKNNSKYDALLLEVIDSVSDSKEKELWRTIKPLDKKRLMECLVFLGFHQRDIFDSFDQADGKCVDIEHPLFIAR